MSKLIEFGSEARTRLRAGVEKMAGVLRITFGPRGRTVMFSKTWGAPQVTSDGATIARQIELEDKFENAGVQLVREVAVKTAETAGDGTTTATLLAEAILVESLHAVEAGYNPITIARGLAKGVDAVVAHLKKGAHKVGGREEIEHVATIAGGNDAEIGKLIAEALDRVGRDGAVIVEESKGIETKLEFIEGYQFDKGFVSPYFVNRPEQGECVLENPLVLVHEKALSNAQDLVPVLESAVRSKRPLLIVAEELQGEVLALLVVNRMQGVMQICAVRAPEFGDRRKEMLEDIATITGARAVMEDSGVALDDLKAADLGTAKRVVVEKERTTIIEGAGKRPAIDARVAQAQAQMDKATGDFDKEKIRARLGKLKGGVAKLSVGAPTAPEAEERRGRFDDALNAARAAYEEGTVAGGGVALARAREALDKVKGDDAAERVGVDILRRAIVEPLKQIADNAGARGSVVLAKVLASKSPEYGFNANTLEYGDLVKEGVLDSVKVARLALENAASVATLLLTTEAVITDKPEPKEAAAAGAPGMGGMGGMPGMM